MARVQNNLLMHGVQGRVGKQLVYKEINGSQFVAQYPDMSQVQYNNVQKEYQKLFGLASAYASEVVNDPQRAAVYEKKIRNDKRTRGKSVYHAAHAAFMAKYSVKITQVRLQKTVQYYLDNYLLNEPQVDALIHLIYQKKLTNAIYQAINKLSKATATRHLQDMINQGIIQLHSRGAGAFYTLAGENSADTDSGKSEEPDLI